MIYGVYDKKSNNGPEPDEAVKTESFSPSYGLAEAMLESAIADYAMFEAMMKVDAMEIKINEKADLLNEAEAEKADSAKKELSDGAAKNIWQKIGAAFKWLAEKISAAVYSFWVKFQTIIKKAHS